MLAKGLLRECGKAARAMSKGLDNVAQGRGVGAGGSGGRVVLGYEGNRPIGDEGVAERGFRF